MGYAHSDAGDSRRATSVPSRRHSEKLRNRDDDFLRQSPASSPAADTSDGGMLDAFDSEFAADPNAGWLNQDIKFGSGPASPTIAQEEAEQQRQHDATPYLDGGNTVTAQLTKNWPLAKWQEANKWNAAKGDAKITSLPDAIKDEDPDVQLDAISDFGPQLNTMRPFEAPRGYMPSGDGNDRGMLDDFDAEFKTGASLDDANLDSAQLENFRIRNRFAFGDGRKQFISPRRSNYKTDQSLLFGGDVDPILPTKTRKPVTPSELRKKFKGMDYLHGGVALDDDDPRTRGKGQEPVQKQKRPGLMSRIGTGISKWWRGSKLNWANWGGSGGQRAG